jgi:hypothetical protein
MLENYDDKVLSKRGYIDSKGVRAEKFDSRKAFFRGS